MLLLYFELVFFSTKSSTVIPESNVGSKMLRKMGWTGVGGVGAAGREGIAEPVSLDAVINREGLGLGTSRGIPRDLAAKVSPEPHRHSNDPIMSSQLSIKIKIRLAIKPN